MNISLLHYLIKNDVKKIFLKVDSKNRVVMQFIRIPGKNYEIQQTQVTQHQWSEIMGSNPSYFDNEQNENSPVENVSWHECKQFIAKLNALQKEYEYRLPTEAEWEYCCRAGTLTDYYWGNEVSLCKFFARYESTGTIKVGSFFPNRFDLYDMLGNVWEWCEDLYDKFGSVRVLRGGSWNSGAQYLRSAYRYHYGPSHRHTLVGFRLVRTKK